MVERKPKFSVVIPVFNSASTLHALHEQVAKTFETLNEDYELILVNDGSRDDSGKVCAALAEKHDAVVFVDLLRNFGQQSATLCGLSESRGQWMITLDDDLQNPPSEIPMLISHAKEGDFEVVYGLPVDKKHQSYRNLGSDFIHGVLRRLFSKSAKGASSFRMISRTVVDCILRYQSSYPFIDGLIFENTSYVGYVDVRHDARTEGKSNYSLRALMLVAMNLFFNFSIAPLRFVFFAGLAISGIAAVFAAYILIGKLTGRISYPGYASIMVYFSLLFGTLFMFLGLIGEYVGRIAQGVNRAPQFAIRKIIKSTDPKA